MTAPGALREFDAVVAPGLEPVLARELTALGLVATQSPGIVRFSANDPQLVQALMATRTATRLLDVVDEAVCRGFPELERFAKRQDLTRWLKPGAPVKYTVTAAKSRLYHTGAITERLEQFLGHPAAPDAPITVSVRVHHDRVRLSVDAAGERLHRRGYRLETAHAPLRESLAAGILMHLGYVGDTPVVDPMCGSGTFPIEAAWIAARRAPGRDRPLACESWPGLSADVAGIRGSLAAQERREGLPELVGVDRDARAVEAARANGERAGVSVEWACADARDLGPGSLAAGLLIANLPYGRRLADAEGALRALEVAARRFVGWKVAALWGVPGPVPGGWTESLRLSNGGLPVRVLYAGSLPK